MSNAEIIDIKKSTDTKEDRKTLFRIFWGKIRQVDRDQLDSDKVYFLKKISFFENLNKNQLGQVASVIYVRDYLTDEYIFETGQPGAALFIIQSGEVSIETESPHGDVTQITTLSKTSFFGELALLNDDPRSASAKAIMPTKVYALFQKDLNAIANKHPDITSQIYKALATVVAKRLKATNEFVDKKLRAVA